ncbi:hypothetical protein [Sansalvadorimonas verongulae]|uniref:hypothetical protein n=1 Tax=Sansalvadorimonas verongulae TaxID=2172824 RepID=UPI0012BD0210|nr:hypothetical protein [Sansalvadorimonas verongulae]MTI13332.1 hypothetical protein [Sansalvadorimonas verongulae]
MSVINRTSIGKLFASAKQALSRAAKALPKGNLKGRPVQKLAAQPHLQQSQSAPSLSTPKQASLQRFQSITALEGQSSKSQIPRPVQQQNKPETQETQREQEEQRELLTKLNKLPAVPTHTPKVETSGKPHGLSETNTAISSAETVSELISLWNHINTATENNGLTFDQRFVLRQRFPGRLNMVSKKTGQAQFVNYKMLKTMIPDMKKRADIAHQILERRLAESLPDIPTTLK